GGSISSVILAVLPIRVEVFPQSYLLFSLSGWKYFLSHTCSSPYQGGSISSVILAVLPIRVEVFPQSYFLFSLSGWKYFLSHTCCSPYQGGSISSVILAVLPIRVELFNQRTVESSPKTSGLAFQSGFVGGCNRPKDPWFRSSRRNSSVPEWICWGL
ncbi:hypothetical protein RRG08_019908, partial [Elysia crispata]